MTYTEVMSTLKAYANAPQEILYEKHGAKGTSWGIKVGDLKVLQKKIGKNQELALALYDSGVAEAQYLASLIADEKKITAAELQAWAKKAQSAATIEYAVPWIAADSGHGWALGLRWVDAKEPHLQCCGWATLASEVTVRKDEDLDIEMLEKLLLRLADTIHGKENRTAYTMNSFLIAVGCCVPSLTRQAQQIGKELGKIQVDMKGTSCKVPFAPEYIAKAVTRGTVGKKKKMARC